jgi:arylsulfatase A-like enzyme
VCSPTRASILSGVHPFRHGIGHLMRPDYSGTLAEYGDPGYSYMSLPYRLAGTCRRGMIGKIHLSFPVDEIVPTGPWTGRAGSGWGILDRLGFQTSSTVLRNISQNDGTFGDGSFYGFGKLDFGSTPVLETRYATTVQVDGAIDFLSGLGGQRGFLYLALNATHAPWGPSNFPPRELVTTQAYLDASEDEANWPSYMASMEAIDAELGRLLASIPPAVRQRTTFVILSDNGPPDLPMREARGRYGLDLSANWQPILNQARLKGSPYHFGVWGPMIWYGPTPDAPGVDRPGQASLALIDVVDLHATIAEYFGAGSGGTDGVSFLDLAWHGGVSGEELTHGRQTSLSELFRPLGDWRQASDFLRRSFRSRVVGAFSRTGLFELVRRNGFPDELYHLEGLLGQPVDLFEASPLDIGGADLELYAHISGQLDELLASSLP